MTGESRELAFRGRFKEALEWVGRTCGDHPALAHALEVASRVAAWGGSEDEVLAALLHDAPPGCASCDDKVAQLIMAARANGVLPGMDALPAAPPEQVPEPVRRILACHLLVHVRALVLDWTALATGWEARQRRLLLEAEEGRRMGWYGPGEGTEHACVGSTGNWLPRRPALLAAYRAWFALPVPATPPPIGVLSLAGPDPGAWEGLRQWADILEAWRLPALAWELRGLKLALAKEVNDALKGFMEAHIAHPATFTQQVVTQCLRRIDLRDLIALHQDPGFAHFMAKVPAHLRESCQRKAELHESPWGCARAGPILSQCLRGLVQDGDLSLHAVPGEAGPPTRSGAITDRLRSGLWGALSREDLAPWPLTAIPGVFHILDTVSLILGSGGGEDLALAGFLEGAPEGAAEPWLGDATGAVPGLRPTDPSGRTLIRHCRRLSLIRFLVTDYAALSPAWGGDPNHRRTQLIAALATFGLILHGRPPGAIAEALLVESRFGMDREGLVEGVWATASCPPELTLLLKLLEAPEDDLMSSTSGYARMDPRQIHCLATMAGAGVLVLAGKDPWFKPALEAFLQALPAQAGRAIREEIDFLPSVDPRESRAARRKLADLAEELRKGWW